jgi:hypothetical protein
MVKLTKQRKQEKRRKKRKNTKEINRERWWTTNREQNKQIHKKIPVSGTIEFQSSSSGVIPSASSPGVCV